MGGWGTMTRGVAILAVVALFASGLLYALKMAYDKGYQERAAEQRVADQDERRRILEELRDAGVDLNDPDAVDSFLLGLSDAE